jgi:hypothetical protein
VVCLCGLDPDDDGREIEAAAEQVAGSGRGWAVGIGRPTEGIAGVRRSYSEAKEAADLGPPHHRCGSAVRFADIQLDQLLRSTPHTEALPDVAASMIVACGEEVHRCGAGSGAQLVLPTGLPSPWLLPGRAESGGHAVVNPLPVAGWCNRGGLGNGLVSTRAT